MKHDLFICDCGTIEHQIIISHDDEDVYLHVHIIPESNILKRIKNAFNYIFNRRRIWGDFDCIILKPEDADKFQKIADKLKLFRDRQNIEYKSK